MKRVIFWICLAAIFMFLFHAAGNTFAGTATYTYDDAGRLIRADYGGGKTITYTYDNNGNLLSAVTTTQGAVQHTLTVTGAGVNGGAMTSPGIINAAWNGAATTGDNTELVDDGSGPYTVTANANAGVVVSWSGDCDSTAGNGTNTAACTVNAPVAADKNLLATFAQATTTYSISGRITGPWAYVGLGGVTVYLAPQGGEGRPASFAAPDGVLTAVTDNNGQYSFTGLAPGGYTLTPCKKGYRFLQSPKNVTVVNANLSNQNFKAALAPFMISGKITRADGKAFKGVTVTLRSGNCVQTAVTNMYGVYAFKVPNGDYTLTPAFEGTAFEPPAREVTVNGASRLKQNFQEIRR